uniref:Uncharacterized protein n=2 Tax=Favella ehrenbergii TaxID=182087 RepID=A0A7S3MPM3_9SPIT
MARRQVENGVHGADAVFAHVRVLVHHILLLLAQAVDHLAHAVSSLRHHNTLSNLMLLTFSNDSVLAVIALPTSRAKIGLRCALRASLNRDSQPLTLSRLCR